MKYLIAPTKQMGDYWAKQMKLPMREHRVISRVEQLRGNRFHESDLIYINGEQFDYPLSGCSDRVVREYRELLIELRSRKIKE